MGTNYYYRERPCPTCKHSPNESHIGKSSGGWVFSFQADYDNKSWKDWQRTLQSGEGIIVDEYGDEMAFDVFKRMVKNKQRNPENYNHALRHPEHSYCDDEGYSFYGNGFLMTNNPIEQPVIVTEDIFLKAALEYCRRIGIVEPFKCNHWQTPADTYHNELADLAERINSLKSVGAI